MPQMEAEQAAALSHVNSLVDALNTKGHAMAVTDFEKLVTSHFDTESPTFIGAAGASHGAADIAKRFHTMFTSRFKKANITMKVTKVTMHAPNVAAVGGSCLVANIATLAGDPVPDLRSNIVTNLVNKDGKWVITSLAIVNETAKVNAPSAH